MAGQAARKGSAQARPSKSHGTFIWHELYAPDAGAAHQFYAELIGWKTKSMDMGPGGEYRMFAKGKSDLAGVVSTKAPQFKGVPPHWLVYIGVDDVDATCAHARKLGGKVLMAPMDIPVGRFAVLEDPQGAVFAVFKPNM